MNLTLNTDAVPSQERFAYWRDAMLRHYGVQACCEPQHQSIFQARLTQYLIGQTLLGEMSGSPHTIIRQFPSTDRRLVVHVQIKGWSLIRQGEQEIQLHPGQIGLFYNSQPVHIEKKESFHSFFISIAEERFADDCPRWWHATATCIPGDSGAAAVFASMLQSLFGQIGQLDAASMEAIEDSAINLLVATLRPHADSQPPGISNLEHYHKQRIKKYIESQLHNPDLDVQTIAEAVGLSRRYIHRLFRNDSLHLMQWVMALRLERCRQALSLHQQPFRTIYEIAYSWGFKDPAHFSKAFRRYFGFCPSEMQKQAGQADSN